MLEDKNKTERKKVTNVKKLGQFLILPNHFEKQAVVAVLLHFWGFHDGIHHGNPSWIFTFSHRAQIFV